MENSRIQHQEIETYLEILKQDELLYRTAQQYIRELDEPEDQMYVVCWAPALVRYVAWVLEEAVRDGHKRLYFLARDAYPMYLVARKLTEKLNVPVEIRYLRVSSIRFGYRNTICWANNVWTAFSCQGLMSVYIRY